MTMKSKIYTKVNDSPVVVLTAFGSTVPGTTTSFDFIEQSARARFRGYEIRWAFTSRTVVRKLKERGVERHGFEEVIANLRTEGCKSVAIQSLHIVPGQEYTAVAEADFKGMEVSVGKALMSSDEDIRRVIKAIEPDIKSGIPNIIVCHGNRDEKYNVQYKTFAKEIQGAHSNVVVSSFEGQLGAEGLKRAAKMTAAAERQAHFVSLLLVAGDHIDNDVMGDGPDSWKNIIGAKNATVSRPLGENEQILAIFWDHLETAIKGRK
jgi:sirohydrochlorin cobaltochelatase